MTLRDSGIVLVTLAVGLFYLTADGPPWLEALYGAAASWATAEIFDLGDHPLYRLAGDPDRIALRSEAADGRGLTFHTSRDQARRNVQAQLRENR